MLRGHLLPMLLSIAATGDARATRHQSLLFPSFERAIYNYKCCVCQLASPTPDRFRYEPGRGNVPIVNANINTKAMIPTSDEPTKCKHTSNRGLGTSRSCANWCSKTLSTQGRPLVQATSPLVKGRDVNSLSKCPVDKIKKDDKGWSCSKEASNTPCDKTIFGKGQTFGEVPECEPRCCFCLNTLQPAAETTVFRGQSVCSADWASSDYSSGGDYGYNVRIALA